ncbi:MAG: recombinase family protein [Actinomycetota bacterium]|nr:recombinase family protein [Actinomycetota bacterium]
MGAKRSAIYVRISQDREGAGLGVERQTADCAALARKLGWTVVATHTDNDLSAYSGKPRPGYRALLAEIDAGRVDAVIVWHTDRLHRSPRELEEYVDLCERRKIVTQTCKAGELDLATPSGRAVARTLGAWARFEVEHKSERTKRAQLQAAQAGRWLGGARPFGWTLRDKGSAVLNRSEAREVRNAATALLAGASVGSIVADLNRRGVTTSTGRPWNYTSLRQVLTRPRNAGLVSLNGEVVGASPWPNLLTEDTWRAVCSLLGDPDRRKSQSNRARWLLAGIATCGTCGAPLRSATVGRNPAKGTTRTVYRCPTAGRGHVARSAEPLDGLITEVIAARLARPDVADLLLDAARRPDMEGLRVDAVALRMRLGEAADSFSDGAISRAQLEKITARTNERLSDVEQSMSGGSGAAVVSDLLGAPNPARQWRAAPVDRRRAIVRALVNVTVLPGRNRGNRFDPDLVHVEWRQP